MRSSSCGWVGFEFSDGCSAWLSLAAAGIAGCASIDTPDSRPLPAGLYVEEPGSGVRTLGADREFTTVPLSRLAHELRSAPHAAPLSVLALSGGGATGAFGAGALVGLTRSGRRPEFSVVTGVSAGALLAPYAFLGAGWDSELKRIYTAGVGARVLRSRGLGAMFGSSLYSGSPLRTLVDRYASDAMIQAVAREAAKGRYLLVATTEYATGERVIWDLTSIAAHGGTQARELFRNVVVASASIPGIFPPVPISLIENGSARIELHVDGGVSTPFFIAPTPADFSAGQDRVALSGSDAPRLFVLIDGQLRDLPHTTPLRATAIFTRSVAAGLSRMTRTTLELTAAHAERDGMPLEYTALPAVYPVHDPFDFRAASVAALFEYGETCAAQGRLWTRFESGARRARAIDESSNGGGDCPTDDAYLERFARRLN